VGTLMWNNSEHMEAYLGIPSMGAVLHTLNLRLPAEQLAWIVNHAEDRVILVNGTLIPLLAPLLPQLPTVAHVVVVGPGDRAPLAGGHARVHDYEELLAGRPEHYDWPQVDERTAAALCYTSGTTGEPKGVVYSHRSLYLHSLQVNTAEAFALASRDIALPVVPMFHVNAWGLPHAAFMAGASLLMPDRFLQPAPLAEMIETIRPTIGAAVPTIWQGLLAELDAHKRDVACLHTVVIGGSACPPALMRGFEERHGIRVVHAWGMTETSPLGCVSHPPAGVSDEEEWAYRATQGRFPASVEARLIGPAGEELPWDGAAAGELEVRGPWIAGAYYGGAQGGALRPEDKFSPDGWLRTGDAGCLDDEGRLYLVDRFKDLIIVVGGHVHPAEVEDL
ncbi:AMP-binding protein, partial [Streptomyces sp. NPDC056405]|uniref:AMP-binding protein n=1 Tax=Streptomyces sp. NPDC056405 TaxID=3345811 RepID=UPI0035E22AC8